MKFAYTKIFIAAFLGLLMLPLRTLALDPAAIADQFYGRRQLIALVANLRILMGDRVFPKVIVGDGGWLAYTAEGDMEGYQNADQFTPEQLVQIQTGLDGLAAQYAKQGITLLVVVAPNKNTIYPERVPALVPVIGAQSRLDQLTAYLRERGKTQLLDLRPALLAAKNKREIYYATDTHWNDYGAYIAYSAILNSLKQTYPLLEPRPRSDFRVVTDVPELLDLSLNTGSTLFPESVIRLAPRFETHTSYLNVPVANRKLMFSSNPDKRLPRLVLYHDSFFFRVIPLLGEHFSRGLFVQNYVAGGLWSLSWVDEVKPDIVMIEFAERYLKDLPLLIATD